MDLEITPALKVPAAELGWRFSRSAGPGGQHVNTSDSRVELSWNVAKSAALTDEQRIRLLDRLGPRMVDGTITVVASEERSQLRNRGIARAKLAERVAAALAPDAPQRRPTKPTRGSQQRRLTAKSQRAVTKKYRQRNSFD